MAVALGGKKVCFSTEGVGKLENFTTFFGWTGRCESWVEFGKKNQRNLNSWTWKMTNDDWEDLSPYFPLKQFAAFFKGGELLKASRGFAASLAKAASATLLASGNKWLGFMVSFEGMGKLWTWIPGFWISYISWDPHNKCWWQIVFFCF